MKRRTFLGAIGLTAFVPALRRERPKTAKARRANVWAEPEVIYADQSLSLPLHPNGGDIGLTLNASGILQL